MLFRKSFSPTATVSINTHTQTRIHVQGTNINVHFQTLGHFYRSAGGNNSWNAPLFFLLLPLHHIYYYGPVDRSSVTCPRTERIVKIIQRLYTTISTDGLWDALWFYSSLLNTKYMRCIYIRYIGETWYWLFD